MPISIQTNINSLVAQENLRVNNDFQSRTIQRLTSGYRINQSGDDAAGLAVANKFRSDVAEITQGVRNANDGVSQLQIIDGGLNGISVMLDRLKTLATQSASDTFTGNRTILDDEYQTLLLEINRQAANIGLGSGDTNAVRYNTDINVYVGGGSQAANGRVSIDLSGNSNLVNASGLLLTGTKVSGSSIGVTLSNANYNAGGPYLNLSSSQTYHFATASSVYNVTVMGTVGGLTGNEIVTQLNAGLAGTGITVSLASATGYLTVSSSSSFGVYVDAMVGTGTQIQAAVADTAAVVNTGKYNFNGGTLSTVTTAGQSITFTPAGGTGTAVTLALNDTADVIVNKLKAGLAGTGIEVVRIGGEVSFQSASDFGITRTAAGDATGIENIGASANVTATDKLASSDPTTDAQTALSSVANAIVLLGNVQGKVGSGQNKLYYAIQLAQSQISSFSAADSRIRDADVAAEAANLTKAQVLLQASMAAMAQANTAPQAVLALLRA